ncbi:tetratricopeptide repeat protein [Bdellovibrio reynosensis]|uniref:Tetratricopeptide repeat protein n=1 Tax=Bdellovibrio reynosensis TaxID=2835041 RepID=A0ABY4C9F8_9BACT|nr:tetratricopeptide repeat protein [Bdellovibrio reynosensis]UOF01109.1 tetratricopeptide repeat protein [Bdellovibrio reynosensis]
MNTENVNKNEKNWLVKSSTRILGPFTLSEVTELLKSKQVSIIDEVRQPEGRWSYIRENQLFMEVVRNIRDEQDSHSEQTMTQSIAHHTMTKTDVLPVSDEMTLTPTPAPHRMDITPPPVRETFKDITPSADKSYNPGAATVSKSYGTADDSRLRAQLQQKSSLIRWGMIAGAVAIVGFVAFSLTQKDKKKNIGYSEMISQAVRYKNLGLYERSLQTYMKAAKLKEPDEEAQIQMAPVLISEDRQSLLGRRILERALVQEGRSRTEVVEAYLGIAVSYIMDGDLKQAEDTLQKAIGHEPFNLSALLNLAIIQLKKGNYTEASREFDAIYKKNPNSSLALYGRALATVEQAKQTPDENNLQSLIRDIKSHNQKNGYLRQELSLFVIYAHNLLGDVDGVNQAVVQFLNQVPGLARNYIHPLNVEWRFTQWDYLEKYCAEIYQKQIPHPELKALRAICLMEVNRDGEASKLLQEAVAEAPKDPYVLSTQASYLAKSGRLPEALVILKMPELSVLSVKNLLMGDICINTQDLNCARAAYNQAFKQDPKSATALFGLAWVMMRSQDRAAAYDYVRAGLQSEPTFLPLLELRDQLESE